MGVKGVKVEYIESDSHFAMRNMYWIIDIAAKHHLVVNFHGFTDPNGENRTYPNILSSEAVCGMEYFKWSDASPVETLMILPLTRNVIGSMEYTPATQDFHLFQTCLAHGTKAYSLKLIRVNILLVQEGTARTGI